MELWMPIAQESKVTVSAEACTGCTANCSIVQPSTTDSLPCYQGTPTDTSKCFYTDPAVASGSKWYCGNCVDYGFPYYYRNDPVYTVRYFDAVIICIKFRNYSFILIL